VGYAFFDAEEVGFMARVPTSELGEGENSAYYDEKQSGVAACGGAPGVSRLGFGWMAGTLA